MASTSTAHPPAPAHMIQSQEPQRRVELADEVMQRIYSLSDRGLDNEIYDGPDTSARFRSDRHKAIALGREAIAEFVIGVSGGEPEKIDMVLNAIKEKQDAADKLGSINDVNGGEKVVAGLGLNGYDIFLLHGWFYGSWKDFYELYFSGKQAAGLLDDLRSLAGSSVYAIPEGEGHEEPSWGR